MRKHESMQRSTNSLLQRVLRALIQNYYGLLVMPCMLWYCKSKSGMGGHYSSATACHHQNI